MEGRKQQHRLFRMQCVQGIYMFLDEIEQIHLQALNKRHYETIIPQLLYTLNSFGQRLISFNNRQLAVYNIPMRTKYFFLHPSLSDISYASFAVLQERFVYIIGGRDQIFSEESGAEKIREGHTTYTVEIPIYDK